MSEQNLRVAKPLITVPNFRVLCGSVENKQQGVQDGVIYRSSRPDFLTEAELVVFRELAIHTIIDFRSCREYLSSSSEGNHVLDQEYDLLEVKLPRGRNYYHDEPVKMKILQTAPNGSNIPRKHYLINFFTMNYIWTVFNRAPWYIRLYSCILLLIDWILNNGYKYFVRLFARTTLNRTGLIGQYKDIVEHSQKSICAALKLLCDKNNLPALMNCAHGKDRTGIVSALVLSCLGKSPEYIAEEYALSSEGLAPVHSRLHSEVVERYHMCEEFTTAEASTMLDLFEHIKNSYGSVQDYLEYIGFGVKEQEILRKNLQEAEQSEDKEKDKDHIGDGYRID